MKEEERWMKRDRGKKGKEDETTGSLYFYDCLVSEEGEEV